MKVIKLGKLREVVCPGCGSILQYDLEEDTTVTRKKVYNIGLNTLTDTNYVYIECPICNKEIDVTLANFNYIKDKRIEE